MSSTLPSDTTTKAAIIVAPDRATKSFGKSVFLAGSIDLGAAVDWQVEATNALKHLPITIYNPRRKEWDSTWPQDPSFPPFHDQVTWELERLENVDVVILYFAPDSKAPISFLEMGLFGRSSRMVVCCPEGFYRRGNVQIVCERYKIELVDTLENLLEAVERRLCN